MLFRYLWRFSRTLCFVGAFVFLINKAYFSAVPPTTLPAAPVTTWQAPTADETFVINTKGDNTKALVRMVSLFAFAKQKSVEFVVLTDAGKPNRVWFYFTQHKTGQGQPTEHVTEILVNNVHHVHCPACLPPLLAQSP